MWELQQDVQAQAQRRQFLLRGLQAAAVAASRAIIPGSGNPPTLLAHQAAKCVASDTSRQANRASTTNLDGLCSIFSRRSLTAATARWSAPSRCRSPARRDQQRDRE